MYFKGLDTEVVRRQGGTSDCNAIVPSLNPALLSPQQTLSVPRWVATRNCIVPGVQKYIILKINMNETWLLCLFTAYAYTVGITLSWLYVVLLNQKLDFHLISTV